MPDSTVVSRYVKVRRLYRQGTGGERDNAREIMSKMEADFPGVSAAADAQEAADEAASSGRAPAPPPRGPADFDWDKVFDLFGGAVNTARTVASRVADVEAGSALAEFVEDDVKITRSNGMHVILKFNQSVLYRMSKLNMLQRAAFKQALQDLIGEHMDQLFAGMDSEEDD